MISRLAKDMQGRWENAKCEILIPANLPDSTFSVLAGLREDPRSLSCLTAFRNLLPLEVASPTADFTRRMMDWARQKMQVQDSTTPQGHDLVLGVTGQRFGRDISLLHYILLNDHYRLSCDTFIEGGKYQSNSVDRFSCIGRPLSPNDALYALRLGALPFEFISGAQQNAATPDERHMILRASEPANAADRQHLRDRGLLQPFPLGRVALSVGGVFGAFSGETPQMSEETFSVLLHTSRPIQAPIHPGRATLGRY